VVQTPVQTSWAGLELRGYFGCDMPLPDYRRPSATIRIDGMGFNSIIRGQQISPRSLPDPVNKHIGEAVPLNGPIAEIESMIEIAKRNEGGEIKLALPDSQDVRDARRGGSSELGGRGQRRVSRDPWRQVARQRHVGASEQRGLATPLTQGARLTAPGSGRGSGASWSEWRSSSGRS
jgi:hypothetical protein